MTDRPVPVRFSPVPLAALVDRLGRTGLLVDAAGADDRHVDHLSFDSREVGPGGLFVAIRGERTDGHLFIERAVRSGAAAVACEETPSAAWPAGVARLQVSDSARALGELACAAFGDPSRSARVIGVTGTNGKTTTAWLCAQVLGGTDRTCGYVGTLGAGRMHALEPATHTTPDAVSLQATIRRMVDEGCRTVAIEVSSHALVQRRTQGTRFEVGVFTNLTRDHLDYHVDFGSYAAAKRLLFEDLPADSTAVVNADDPAWPLIVADTPPRTVRFGRGEDADIRYTVLDDGIGGLVLRLDGHERRFRLSGAFNAENLAAAYSAMVCVGMDGLDAVDGLASAEAAPGRFERVEAPGRAAFLVDYAHTPDALARALEAARPLVPERGELWCVFGCGGDRDAGKRPQMGAVAEEGADRVIVTSDNPRAEDPLAILADIRGGMVRPDDALWIADRRTAIREAARRATEGDVVLVAGKGHETVQVVGGVRIPFDDRLEIREACSEVA